MRIEVRTEERVDVVDVTADVEEVVDGGGQVLRTPLSLSALTETPFRIENVRGARPDPGLKPQHFAAVDLLADLCDADVEGAEVGSEAVMFWPDGDRETQPSLSVAVGTAGSVTLALDALLPVAATADEPIEATATGGTDVKWSPTVEYVRQVKLPLLATAGLDADLSVARRGFYPAGGGEVTLRTHPSSLSALELDARGNLERVGVYSTASEGLADADVAERQADRAADRLEDAGLPAAVCRADHVETNLNVVDAFGSDVRLAREAGRPVLAASAHTDL